jgi:hypothetical protein
MRKRLRSVEVVQKLALSVSLVFMVSVTSPAIAVKLTNLDKRSYEVTVEENGKSQMHKIEPGATLDGLCSDKGCKVSLVDVPDGAYIMEGNETVTIEKGLIYYAKAYVSKEAPGDAIKNVAKDGKPMDGKPGTGKGNKPKAEPSEDSEGSTKPEAQ